MLIRCPFCSFKIEVKSPAGAYQPKCPKCHEAFVLIVPREAGQNVIVAKSVEKLKAHQAKKAAASAADLSTGFGAATQPGPARVAHPPAPSSATQQTLSQPSPTDATVATPPPHAATAARSQDMQQTMTEPSARPGLASIRSTDSHHAEAEDLPMHRLDGYELVRLIGRGGMGRVYLAKQVSLDRDVAVKTIDPKWSRDPAFLARFVREAYAVAQLSHHNVVQIHDIGQTDDVHFFSMEYVDGQSLTDRVKTQGPLDAEEAATYILHAARGLKFAHDHHMVHRDVKPSNLLLGEQGLVKLADLGLVKTPSGKDQPTLTKHGSDTPEKSGSALASSGSAIGTPAYMAPEQARDAASVDVRADIYALGATFYHLVTGRPPFDGQTTDILIRQHAQQPLTPPEQIAKRLPKPLSIMIQKMLAKRPEDRYPDMGAVIEALEGYLGIEAGPFTPRREHSSALELAVEGFNKALAVRVRRGLMIGFFAVLALVIVLGILRGSDMWVGGAIGLGLFTTLAYQLLSGIVSGSVLMRKVRQYVFSSGWRQWLMAVGGVIVIAAVLFAMGLHWLYLGTLIAGIVLAAGFYFGIDGWAATQRKPHVEGVRQMLKDMRLRGLEEDALRRFVCRYSGKHWEAFYEALFGYEAKITARRNWGKDLDGRARPRYAGWRDGLIEWLDLHQQQREEARQRRHLQRVELQRLRAEGVDDQQAMAEARRAAGDLVERASEYRDTGRRRAIAEVVRTEPIPDDWDEEDEVMPESWKIRKASPSSRLATWVLGGRGRFIAGAAMLAVWAMWATQRDVLPAFVFLENTGGQSLVGRIRGYLKDRPAPLDIAGVPDSIMQVLCSQPAALAGIVLVISAMFRGKKMTLFILPVIILLLRAPFMNTAGDGWLGLLTPYEWTLLIALALTPFALFFGKIRYT